MHKYKTAAVLKMHNVRHGATMASKCTAPNLTSVAFPPNCIPTVPCKPTPPKRIATLYPAFLSAMRATDGKHSVNTSTPWICTGQTAGHTVGHTSSASGRCVATPSNARQCQLWTSTQNENAILACRQRQEKSLLADAMLASAPGRMQSGQCPEAVCSES